MLDWTVSDYSPNTLFKLFPQFHEVFPNNMIVLARVKMDKFKMFSLVFHYANSVSKLTQVPRYGSVFILKLNQVV